MSPGTASAPVLGAAPALPTPTARLGAGAGWTGFVSLCALIVLLQFGPLIGLIGFRLDGGALWPYIGLLRDVLVAVLVWLALVHAVGNTRPGAAWGPAQHWAMAIILGSVLATLAAEARLSLVALNLRRMALMPLLFLAVGLLPLQRAQLVLLLRLLVGTSVIAGLLAVADRLLGDALWTEWLLLDEYTAANALDRFGWAAFEQNGRYFSGDLNPLFGEPLRRAIGSYLEPTTLAAGMSAALALGLARRARGHASTLLLAVVLVAGLLTISKGHVLYLLLLLAWRWFGVPAPSQALWLGAVAIGASVLSVAIGGDRGPLIHLAGVSSGLAHLADGNWLGQGLGELGNYSNDTSETGSESGLGNAIGQVGLLAVLPLFWMRAVALQTLERARVLADPGGPWLASWALFWTTSYVMSASSQGIGGNALGFLMLALYLHPNALQSRP